MTRIARIPAGALHNGVLLLLLGGLLALAGFLNPRFLSSATQASLAGQAIELAILTIPMTAILITGGIDLSVGAAAALCSVVFGLSFQAGLPVAVCAILALATGAAAGLLNGWFVARLRIHPLIVTLATLSLFRGIAEGVSLGRPVSGFPDAFVGLARLPLLGAPLPLWGFAALLLAAWIALSRTAAGRCIYAIGLNETACRFSGIAVERIKLALYGLSGAAAGLAAVLYAARLNTAKADIAAGLELDVITAVVLGGTSVFGGRGGYGGTLLGILLLHEVRQFVSWQWNSDELILVLVGLLLIGSMLLNRALSSRDA